MCLEFLHCGVSAIISNDVLNYMATGFDNEIMFGVSLGINILIWPSIGWLINVYPSIKISSTNANFVLRLQKCLCKYAPVHGAAGGRYGLTYSTSHERIFIIIQMDLSNSLKAD